MIDQLIRQLFKGDASRGERPSKGALVNEFMAGFMGSGRRQLPSARMSRTLLGMHTNIPDERLDWMVENYPLEARFMNQGSGKPMAVIDKDKMSRIGEMLRRRMF